MIEPEFYQDQLFSEGDEMYLTQEDWNHLLQQAEEEEMFPSVGYNQSREV
jgi:hypothetical protein